jgi:apolipoprotein N-acyltransferase
MQPSSVGIAAAIVGCAVTVVGLAAYQAWWTVVFAIGGLAVAFLSERDVAPARSMAIGLAIGGSILLAGMSVFFLFGSGWGGTPWFVASIASIVTAIILGFLARRLLRQRPARDRAQH